MQILLFAEVRGYLEVETQRLWSYRAIERSTSCLMALFSIICLLANQMNYIQSIKPNTTAWYRKKQVTFSDIQAAVRINNFTQNQILNKQWKNPCAKFS